MCCGCRYFLCSSSLMFLFFVMLIQEFQCLINMTKLLSEKPSMCLIFILNRLQNHFCTTDLHVLSESQRGYIDLGALNLIVLCYCNCCELPLGRYIHWYINCKMSTVSTKSWHPLCTTPFWYSESTKYFLQCRVVLYTPINVYVLRLVIVSY